MSTSVHSIRPHETPRSDRPRRVSFLAPALLALGALSCASLLASPSPASPSLVGGLEPRTYLIRPSEGAAFELQERLIDAVPGDVIQLEEGTYRLQAELDIACDHITLRGRGPQRTVLSFLGQDAGSDGVHATGSAFVIEDLAVEDTVGNAIKVLGANGVIFRRVRVEWTLGPRTDNGAYGVYPVQCSNVLIEDCIVRGASDAGIYVGQSSDVIVRRCRAEANVAGIEIENTLRADVHDNVATGNTGGILVFDLPGLQVTNGGRVRVFRNRLLENNLANFARPGNMVATVPQGTGLMVLATDDVEVFENTIAGNDSASVTVASYSITGRPVADPAFDPFPEGIWVHDNRVTGGGKRPKGALLELLLPLLGLPFPDIFYDGVLNPRALVDGKLPEDRALRLLQNGEATFVNARLGELDPDPTALGKHRVDRDPTPFTGSHAPLAEVRLGPWPERRSGEGLAASVYRKLPRRLSEWGLFEGTMADLRPARDLLPYELNTPLFSDYTAKRRLIRLPEGQAMEYRDKAVLDFPVGTLVVKTFSMPRDLRQTDGPERLLETRIEERRETGWFGYSYVWEDDQDDALLQLGGGSLDVAWTHADGSSRRSRYQVPNANQCIACHGSEGKFVPLGPTARNLNRGLERPAAPKTQLERWSEAGLLRGLPAAESVSRLARFDDPASGTVADRARAWLEVNCAHCHNPTGSARTSGLDLDSSETRPGHLGLWKSPVATGRASGGRSYDIVPGKPDESILLFRIESTEPGVRMPTLARSVVHEESVALIREWIASLPSEKKPSAD